ncbi:MAG TPA: hypothetical protein VH062_09460 [Polyangiaceae bacterium]|jgi:hypothetical protein|nr:hypothetical protein [Polyangiaceae bacterium]
MAHRSIAADTAEPKPADTDRPPPRLVLASEALREDMAPLEPDRRVGQEVTGGIAVALALLGIVLRQHAERALVGDAAASLTFAAAGAAAAIALLPFSYSVRALAVFSLGVVMMLLGADSAGPLAGLRIGSTTELEVTRLIVLATLPGALLFRARYRGYPRARLVLGLALFAAAPFAVSRGLVAADSAATVVDRVAAGIDLAVILAGLFGFMGADTTGGGSVWASLVILFLSLDIYLRELGTPANMGLWAEHAATAVAAACAATLTSVGVYHLLAARLAWDARRLMRRRGSTDALLSENP